MINHELKIQPCYFNAILSGDKLFEIRRNNDRGFQKGDTVTLRECDLGLIHTLYSGREINAEITYVTNYEQKPEFVVFGIKNPELVTKPQSEVEARHA